MVVGKIVGLWRYPVKSMAGEALVEAEVGWHGLAGDRRWAFIRPGVERSGFPWLTQRQHEQMRRFTPSFADPQRPDRSPTTVRTPEGAQFDVTDPALAAVLGDGVRIIKQDVGIFDSLPLSLISTQTLNGIEQLVDRPMEPERFRPNFLVETDDAQRFPEDGWVGRSLRIGTMRMQVNRRDPRCVIVTIDPATGRREAGILRQIARRRAGAAGVYGSVEIPGRVVLGDAVTLD